MKKAEGAGVGLYLTRSILEQQGGPVSFQSVYSQGSTFVLQLRR